MRGVSPLRHRGGGGGGGGGSHGSQAGRGVSPLRHGHSGGTGGGVSRGVSLGDVSQNSGMRGGGSSGVGGGGSSSSSAFAGALALSSPCIGASRARPLPSPPHGGARRHPSSLLASVARNSGNGVLGHAASSSWTCTMFASKTSGAGYSAGAAAARRGRSSERRHSRAPSSSSKATPSDDAASTAKNDNTEEQSDDVVDDEGGDEHEHFEWDEGDDDDSLQAQTQSSGNPNFMRATSSGDDDEFLYEPSEDDNAQFADAWAAYNDGYDDEESNGSYLDEGFNEELEEETPEQRTRRLAEESAELMRLRRERRERQQEDSQANLADLHASVAGVDGVVRTAHDLYGGAHPYIRQARDMALALARSGSAMLQNVSANEASLPWGDDDVRHPIVTRLADAAERGDTVEAEACVAELRMLRMRPGSRVYHALVHAYAVNHDVKGTLSATRRASRASEMILLDTYLLLLRLLVMRGDYRRAELTCEAVMRDAERRGGEKGIGYEPGDVWNAMTLIYFQAGAGARDAAFAWYERGKSDMGFTPSLDVYELAIRAMADDLDVTRCYDEIDHMRHVSGLAPQPRHTNPVAMCECRSRFKAVDYLVQRMLNPHGQIWFNHSDPFIGDKALDFPYDVATQNILMEEMMCCGSGDVHATHHEEIGACASVAAAYLSTPTTQKGSWGEVLLSKFYLDENKVVHGRVNRPAMYTVAAMQAAFRCRTIGKELMAEPSAEVLRLRAHKHAQYRAGGAAPSMDVSDIARDGAAADGTERLPDGWVGDSMPPPKRMVGLHVPSERLIDDAARLDTTPQWDGAMELCLSEGRSGLHLFARYGILADIEAAMCNPIENYWLPAGREWLDVLAMCAEDGADLSSPYTFLNFQNARGHSPCTSWLGGDRTPNHRAESHYGRLVGARFNCMGWRDYPMHVPHGGVYDGGMRVVNFPPVDGWIFDPVGQNPDETGREVSFREFAAERSFKSYDFGYPGYQYKDLREKINLPWSMAQARVTNRDAGWIDTLESMGIEMPQQRTDGSWTLPNAQDRLDAYDSVPLPLTYNEIDRITTRYEAKFFQRWLRAREKQLGNEGALMPNGEPMASFGGVVDDTGENGTPAGQNAADGATSRNGVAAVSYAGANGDVGEMKEMIDGIREAEANSAPPTIDELEMARDMSIDVDELRLMQKIQWEPMLAGTYRKPKTAPMPGALSQHDYNLEYAHLPESERAVPPERVDLDRIEREDPALHAFVKRRRAAQLASVDPVDYILRKPDLHVDWVFFPILAAEDPRVAGLKWKVWQMALENGTMYPTSVESMYDLSVELTIALEREMLDQGMRVGELPEEEQTAATDTVLIYNGVDVGFDFRPRRLVFGQGLPGGSFYDVESGEYHSAYDAEEDYLVMNLKPWERDEVVGNPSANTPSPWDNQHVLHDVTPYGPKVTRDESANDPGLSDDEAAFKTPMDFVGMPRHPLDDEEEVGDLIDNERIQAEDAEMRKWRTDGDYGALHRSLELSIPWEEVEAEVTRHNTILTLMYERDKQIAEKQDAAVEAEKERGYAVSSMVAKPRMRPTFNAIFERSRRVHVGEHAREVFEAKTEDITLDPVDPILASAQNKGTYLPDYYGETNEPVYEYATPETQRKTLAARHPELARYLRIVRGDEKPADTEAEERSQRISLFREYAQMVRQEKDAQLEDMAGVATGLKGGRGASRSSKVTVGKEDDGGAAQKRLERISPYLEDDDDDVSFSEASASGFDRTDVGRRARAVKRQNDDDDDEMDSDDEELGEEEEEEEEEALRTMRVRRKKKSREPASMMMDEEDDEDDGLDDDGERLLSSAAVARGSDEAMLRGFGGGGAADDSEDSSDGLATSGDEAVGDLMADSIDEDDDFEDDDAEDALFDDDDDDDIEEEDVDAELLAEMAGDEEEEEEDFDDDDDVEMSYDEDEYDEDDDLEEEEEEENFDEDFEKDFAGDEGVKELGGAAFERENQLIAAVPDSTAGASSLALKEQRRLDTLARQWDDLSDERSLEAFSAVIAASPEYQDEDGASDGASTLADTARAKMGKKSDTQVEVLDSALAEEEMRAAREAFGGGMDGVENLLSLPVNPAERRMHELLGSAPSQRRSDTSDDEQFLETVDELTKNLMDKIPNIENYFRMARYATVIPLKRPIARMSRKELCQHMAEANIPFDLMYDTTRQLRERVKNVREILYADDDLLNNSFEGRRKREKQAIDHLSKHRAAKWLPTDNYEYYIDVYAEGMLKETRRVEEVQDREEVYRLIEPLLERDPFLLRDVEESDERLRNSLPLYAGTGHFFAEHQLPHESDPRRMRESQLERQEQEQRDSMTQEDDAEMSLTNPFKWRGEWDHLPAFLFDEVDMASKEKDTPPWITFEAENGIDSADPRAVKAFYDKLCETEEGKQKVVDLGREWSLKIKMKPWYWLSRPEREYIIGTDEGIQQWDPDGFMFAQEWAKYVLKKTASALPTGSLAKDEFDDMLSRNAALDTTSPSELMPASYRAHLADPFTTNVELAEQRYYWRPVHTNGDIEDLFRANFSTRQRSTDPAGGVAPTMRVYGAWVSPESYLAPTMSELEVCVIAAELCVRCNEVPSFASMRSLLKAAAVERIPSLARRCLPWIAMNAREGRITHGEAHQLLTCAELLLLEEAGYHEPPMALRHLYSPRHPHRERALANGYLSSSVQDLTNLWHSSGSFATLDESKRFDECRRMARRLGFPVQISAGARIRDSFLFQTATSTKGTDGFFRGLGNAEILPALAGRLDQEIGVIICHDESELEEAFDLLRRRMRGEEFLAMVREKDREMEWFHLGIPQVDGWDWKPDALRFLRDCTRGAYSERNLGDTFGALVKDAGAREGIADQMQLADLLYKNVSYGFYETVFMVGKAPPSADEMVLDERHAREQWFLSATAGGCPPPPVCPTVEGKVVRGGETSRVRAAKDRSMAEVLKRIGMQAVDDFAQEYSDVSDALLAKEEEEEEQVQEEEDVETWFGVSESERIAWVDRATRRALALCRACAREGGFAWRPFEVRRLDASARDSKSAAGQALAEMRRMETFSDALAQLNLHGDKPSMMEGATEVAGGPWFGRGGPRRLTAVYDGDSLSYLYARASYYMKDEISEEEAAVGEDTPEMLAALEAFVSCRRPSDFKHPPMDAPPPPPLRWGWAEVARRGKRATPGAPFPKPDFSQFHGDETRLASGTEWADAAQPEPESGWDNCTLAELIGFEEADRPGPSVGLHDPKQMPSRPWERARRWDGEDPLRLSTKPRDVSHGYVGGVRTEEFADIPKPRPLEDKLERTKAAQDAAMIRAASFGLDDDDELDDELDDEEANSVVEMMNEVEDTMAAATAEDDDDSFIEDEQEDTFG